MKSLKDSEVTRARLYVDEFSLGSRIRRAIWLFAYFIFFKYSPSFLFRKWRLFVLRLFGAKIGVGCKVSPSCFVWAPWNLTMGDYSCLADGVDCYSIGKISLGNYTTVSQRSFLCSASHDISKIERPLFHRPITIEDHAWVCAEAFVGPGVTIQEGAVVGARSVVVRDVRKWTVVTGSPAVYIKDRILK